MRAKCATAVAIVLVACLSGADLLRAQAPAPSPKPTKQTTPSAKEHMPQVAGKSLCVVSAIGDRFNVQTVGLMVFGNSLHTAAIGSWRLDDLVVHKISATYGGRYAVRRITPPAAALKGLEQFSGGIFSNPEQGAATAIRQIAASAPNCGIYITVNRSSSGYGTTNQSVQGVGILEHSSPILSRHFVFASIIIRSFDGRTLELLHAKAPDNANFLSLLTSQHIHGLVREVGRDVWPATPEAAAQNAQLRMTTRSLIENGLANALPSIL